MDFKLLDYVIRMIPIDTIVNILGLFATFFGALAGAFIAGHYTLKAINKDLEERKITAKKDKEEHRQREEKKIKTRLLFEMDNLIAFNNTIADNLFRENSVERLRFLRNLILYDKNSDVNLSLLEMKKLRELLLNNHLNYKDDETQIYKKFEEVNGSSFSIVLSSEKIKRVKGFLNNTEQVGEMCLYVDGNSLLRLKEFNSNLQELSQLIYVLSSDELNMLYGIKQTIKIIIENILETKSGNIYKIDKYYFVHNILINQLNVMCKNIL